MSKLLVGLLFGLALPWSFSMTIKGQQEVCTAFAEYAASTVSVRDAGVTWEEFDAWLTPALERSLKTEGSNIRDADDSSYIHSTMKEIWASQDDALTIMARVHEGCMKS